MAARASIALQATAFHEAGHAVAAWSCGLPVYRVSIQPEGDAKGVVSHRNPLARVRLDLDGSDKARMKAEAAIIVCLAGPASQRRFNARSYRKHHSASDFDTAAELALRLNSSAEAANAYLDWLRIRADDLIAGRWKIVTALAGLLLERAELGRDAVPLAIQRAVEGAR